MPLAMSCGVCGGRQTSVLGRPVCQEGNAMTAQTPEGTLGAFSHGEHPIFAQLAKMSVDTLPNSELDPRTYHIVRLAALIAMDAAPASYLANLAVAREAGLTVQDAQGVCVAIAPIVGSSRVVDAAGNVLRAFGLAELAAEYVAEEDVTEEGAIEEGVRAEGSEEGTREGTGAGTGEGMREGAGGGAAGAVAGGAAGAGAATAIPGQRREEAATELGEDKIGEDRIEEGRLEESRIEQESAERVPEGRGPAGYAETTTEERFVEGSGAGGGAAMYEESREERFAGGPESAQGASGVTGAREAAEGRAEQGREERGGQGAGGQKADEPGTGEKQGFGEQVQGAKEKAQGAKEKLTGEGEKEETIEEKLRGKVSGWMKRDQ
ncbi:carboxymuconolactone decarboxylase family protein [Actinopolymorpha sp. NPDC004070]|uniref:carboxymuconolactone decarboxylase family protein n=1 Tax=Actinopolymorpha sp. NPDC004070 TaxID=3154548 RepID=UPI0033B6CFF4